jgi:hypothetical protein
MRLIARPPEAQSLPLKFTERRLVPLAAPRRRYTNFQGAWRGLCRLLAPLRHADEHQECLLIEVDRKGPADGNAISKCREGPEPVISASCPRIEQRRCLLQIRGIESLGKPAVDRCE